MDVIKIENLTKDYGNGKGIFDVTFSVKEGEVVGVLGSNGAGKTTTIRHLMGFIHSEKGKAQILGKDCFLDALKVQEKVGYLPGEIAFMDNMSGNEFIQFMAQMKKVKNLEYAQELMDYLEVDTKVKIKKMSKGMKQKIGLIIAFMQNAPVLILDEPTTGLDPIMQNKFVGLVKKEKALGKTILMSSHIFEEVENTCDRVVMIKDGKIVADEDINKIKNNRVKHYEITFSDTKSAESFQRLYSDSKRQEKIVFLSLKNQVNELIKQLSLYDVRDIAVRNQTLEEVFLHYYKEEK